MLKNQENGPTFLQRIIFCGEATSHVCGKFIK